MNAKRKVQFEECDISGDRRAPLLPVVHAQQLCTHIQDYDWYCSPAKKGIWSFRDYSLNRFLKSLGLSTSSAHISFPDQQGKVGDKFSEELVDYGWRDGEV